ncbi:MAG: TlpA family protein disulfide reductase [Proteobacteria bacterium]|nr:TlpA family protein disulfide reductase [Pseudomonadota bacterium]
MARMHIIAMALLLAGEMGWAKPAPPFQAELLGGRRISLKQSLKPGRGLILCFWATWCAPCLQELKEVSTRLKNDPTLPLDMLAVNVDTAETASDVGPTLKLYGFDFPVAMDPRHEIFSKYQSSKSLPFSALVNNRGEISKTFSGFHEQMMDEIKKELSPERSAIENKI